MPVTKEFKTLDEQIAILDSRHLKFKNKKKAKKLLGKYNYFDVINGFESILLKKNVPNKEYDNVYFEDFKDLFFFDMRLKKYTLFKIGKFQVVKNIIYEKDTASVIRTKKEAQDYALIQIYQDYEANRTSKKEKIDSIQLINFIEYEDRYYFKFIVSACKNIVEFKPF